MCEPFDENYDEVLDRLRRYGASEQVFVPGGDTLVGLGLARAARAVVVVWRLRSGALRVLRVGLLRRRFAPFRRTQADR